MNKNMMTQEQFLYWLQGMLEYTNLKELSANDMQNKLQGIKDHLELVFVKVTPSDKPVNKPIYKQLDIDTKKSDKTKEETDFEKTWKELAKRVTDNKPSLPLSPYDRDFERFLPRYYPNEIPGWGSPPSTPFGRPIIYC